MKTQLKLKLILKPLVILFLILQSLSVPVIAGLLDPALLTQKKPRVSVIALLSTDCVSTKNDFATLKAQNKACAYRVASKIGVTQFRPIWINHSLALEVTPKQLRLLNQNPLVKKIYYNQPMRPDNSVSDYKSSYQFPYSFGQIHLDKVIVKEPKLDGANQLIGIIDTGVDGNHSELKGKIKLFFDAQKNKIEDTYSDEAGHGTHVAGILVGGSRTGKHIGVAPAAKLVAVKITNIESAVRGMQFIAEQPGVRVVNNSWGEQKLPDIEIYYRALSVWDSLGIIPVFSAGNAGPKPLTLTHPKEHPATIVVGATLKSGEISPTSSRGPGNFKGMVLHKPELVAPGEKIVSTLPDDTLGEWSGSSMAAPLVTGTIALMLQIHPYLSNFEVRNILSTSAQGFSGAWSPDYGFGLLDVNRAIEMTKESFSQNTEILTMLMRDVLPKEPVDNKNRDTTEMNVFSFPKYLEGTTWIQKPEAKNNKL